MYLNLINKNSKRLFLALANSLGNADGELSDVEKVMIDEYCREMQIENDTDVSFADNEKIMEELAKYSDDRERKIIVLELIGLAYADDDFSVNEKASIDKLTKIFGLEAEYVHRCEELVKKYLDIQKQFNHLIFG